MSILAQFMNAEQPHLQAPLPAATSHAAVVRLSDLVYQWPGAARPLLHIQALDVEKGQRVFVQGASGSGKSSLVLAGMVPAFEKEIILLGRALQVRYLTPGRDPETILARQLEDPPRNGQTVLLVADQFEELFTLCTDPAARKLFLDKLLNAWNERSDLHLVLTLRADFLGDCAPYLVFRDLLEKHLKLLEPMTPAELRTSMEQQASSVGLRFEGGLSHTILSEVEGEPGAMPLLQHLLLHGLHTSRHFGHLCGHQAV